MHNSQVLWRRVCAHFFVVFLTAGSVSLDPFRSLKKPVTQRLGVLVIQHFEYKIPIFVVELFWIFLWEPSMFVVLAGKHFDRSLCPFEVAVAIFAHIPNEFSLGFGCGFALAAFFFLVAADRGLHSCDCLIPERVVRA
jgi:hypothetical protein